MSTSIDTGKKLKLIETDDINKIPFFAGQFIIVDDSAMYYDSTIGKSIDDRICLTPKREIDVHVRTENKTDEYYLSLCVNPINNDIVIIKDLIPNSTEYSNTIYIYNNNDEDSNDSNWCKLTDFYNAKNIYLNEDIEITIPINDLKNTTIPAAGKNIEDVIQNIFSPDVLPVVSQPSINLTFPQAGSYEIGSVVTPNYSISFNPGEYEYGPDTDVEAELFMAASSTGVTKETQSDSFNQITINETTDFYMSASVVYSDGNIPLTRKGNEYSDGAIKSDSISIESNHITGYVNGLFYGCVNENVIGNINSDLIRGLNKSGKAYEAETVKLLVNANTKAIIIACPKSNIGVSKIHNNTVNCDMTAAFGTPSSIMVKGNSDDDAYAREFNVWVYMPAEPYLIDTELTITLS